MRTREHGDMGWICLQCRFCCVRFPLSPTSWWSGCGRGEQPEPADVSKNPDRQPEHGGDPREVRGPGPGGVSRHRPLHWARQHDGPAVALPREALDAGGQDLAGGFMRATQNPNDCRCGWVVWAALGNTALAHAVEGKHLSGFEKPCPQDCDWCFCLRSSSVPGCSIC